MTVSLTVSDTLDGLAVDDAISNSTGTGIDLGSVQNGSYSDVGDQNLNEGARDLYIRHDAVVDPITDCKTYLQAFLTDLPGGSYNYGGPGTSDPAADLARILLMGDTSGDSKNNAAPGASEGLWIDMDWDVATINQFDYTTNGYDGSTSAGGNDTVSKYGDNGQVWGANLANAIPVKGAAMVYDNTGETAASAAVDGSIGIDGDTTLGDNAHIKLRIYLASGFDTGGIHQVEYVIAYSFTA